MANQLQTLIMSSGIYIGIAGNFNDKKIYCFLRILLLPQKSILQNLNDSIKCNDGLVDS